MPNKPRNRMAQDITRIQKRVIDRRLDTLERQIGKPVSPRSRSLEAELATTKQRMEFIEEGMYEILQGIGKALSLKPQKGRKR